MSTSRADVLIVGSGPAGLHAAVELRRFGYSVVILERDAIPGGVPRWCDHHTFPCRIKKRLFRGPEYARVWTDEARASGASIVTQVAVLRLVGDGPSVATTSPQGLTTFEARVMLLATGARESHRHNRLVAGNRTPGIFTTASLFQYLNSRAALPAQRFVVFGSEDVSYSCIHAILKHGGRVAAVLETAPLTRSYRPVQWYFEKLRGVHHQFSVENVAIHGAGTVTQISFLVSARPDRQFVDCEAVVFTGGFIPNAELVRDSTVVFNFNTRGPSVNQQLQTSHSSIFAAGNCLRGVVSADEAALEGRIAARAISGYLQGQLSFAAECRLVVESPLQYCFPDRLRPESSGVRNVAIWCGTHCRNVRLAAKQNNRVIWQQRFARIQPGRRLFVPIAGLVLNGGEPIHFSLD